MIAVATAVFTKSGITKHSSNVHPIHKMFVWRKRTLMMPHKRESQMRKDSSDDVDDVDDVVDDESYFKSVYMRSTQNRLPVSV